MNTKTGNRWRKGLSWTVWGLAFFAMILPSVQVFADPIPSPSPFTQGDVFSVTNNSFFYDPTAKACTAGNTVGSVSGGDSTAATSQQQAANAQIIIGIAKTEGLDENAAIIGIMAALDESELIDLANENVPLSEQNPNKQGDGSDGTSLGVFQQQISEDWSTFTESDINNADAVNQLMTVAYDAEAFFGSPPGSNAPNALSKGLQNHSGWESLQPWVAAQAVQQSGTPDGSNYKAKYAQAQQLVAQYFNSSPAVPLPVPLTGGPASGGGSTVGAGGTGETSDNCTCSASGDDTTSDNPNDSTANANPGAPTIVLDPGHASNTDVQVDPATNEPVFDYTNTPEQKQVWDLSQDLTKKLVNAGYNVLNTKNSEDDTSTDLKKRADTGNDGGGALGISIHTTPGSNGVGNDVFVPKVGEFLVKVNGQHDVYSNKQLADTDQTYGNQMGDALQNATGLNFRVGGYDDIYGPITRTDPNQANLVMKGTMLVTQYFANIPWLYLERYQDNGKGAVSDDGMSAYETGILNGVEKIVPTTGKSAGSTDSTDTSDLSDSPCNSPGVSPNCQNAVGVAQILCDAKLYDSVSYQESVAGGHQGGAAWHASCPVIGPSCYLDCSGLVNIAVYDVYGVDLVENTFSEISDAQAGKYWKVIQFDDLQPGDLILPPIVGDPEHGHVEIVDHVQGNTIFTFGAHSSTYPQPDQVGPDSFTKDSADVYLHYSGGGSQ